MAGHGNIGQMPVERERRQHLYPVDGRTLRLVDRCGVAVIEIAIEPLIDGNAVYALALANTCNDTARRSLDDLTDHAVLDAKRAFILKEHDLVANGELPGSILGLEGVAFFDQTALNELFTRHDVELAYIAAQMREYQG